MIGLVTMVLCFSALVALEAVAGPLFGGFASPACSEDLAIAAFSRGDISGARAELMVYKDAARTLKECAQLVWKRGVASMLNATNVERGLSFESKVLARLGNSRSLCDAKVEDGSWLDIPRLVDVIVCMPTAGNHVLVLEQDGFLRPFDMRTVLWPAGYFLTLWISRNCQSMLGRVLELGSGVGAPSIAASLCQFSTQGSTSHFVLSTDNEEYGLANVRSNSKINAAQLQTAHFDWHSDEDLEAITQRGPFDIVLGSGLAIPRWSERFWSILPKLLHPRTGKVVLCHGTGDLDLAPLAEEKSGFALERRISGDDYALGTRWGTPSEFEIVILQRGQSAEL